MGDLGEHLEEEEQKGRALELGTAARHLGPLWQEQRGGGTGGRALRSLGSSPGQGGQAAGLGFAF